MSIAAKAAHKREPIILRGFDRRRQLDISFQTIHFGAVWLRRTYTDEYADHITLRTTGNEVRLQEVRYGNNITVLLKACYHLRQYYNSRDFWPAIARGFGASADVVRDMVELFVEARNIYHRDDPDEEELTRSGANVAADKWLDFSANRGRDNRTGWETRDSEAPNSDLFGHARAFFNDSEGKQVDLANVLPKRIDYQHYSTSESRKRFASHEPSGRPPSPKRRPSSNYFDRSDTFAARISQPLTPISTGSHIRESARQDYQTPISTSDRPPWANSSSQGSPEVATEVFSKIRGTASQNKNGLPAIESRELTPNHALSNGFSDVESQKMREKIASLEKELSDVKSRLSNDQHHRHLVNKILSDHGLIGIKRSPSKPDPPVMSMQAQIASLEVKFKEEAARHAHEIKGVKESMEIAKQEIAILRDNSVKEEVLASGHDQDVNPSLLALQMIQGKLTSIEDRLLGHGTAEAQNKLSAPESRVTIVQPQVSQASTPANQRMDERPTSSRNEMAETGAHDQVDVLDKISKLEDAVSGLSNRVSKLEAETGEGDHVNELERRVQVIEHQRDTDRQEYVIKHSVGIMFEQLDSRLNQEKNAASKQLQDIHLRLMATEIQNSRLLKTVDVPETPKGLSPSQNGQRSMEEVCKTIDSLPTEAYVTDMIFKREQVSKSENEKIWGFVNDLSARISSLPTVTLVSEIIDERNQTFKSDVEKLRRNLDDMLTNINSLPNKAYVSERLFRLEQSLRDELVRHRKDVEGVVGGPRKDLVTLKAQVKGLNMLWNEAITGIAKSDSLVALKVEIDTLKGDIANQSKRVDDSSQGLNTARKDTIAALQRQVADLSTQLHTALSEVSLEKLVQRLQEAPSENFAQAATRDARFDNVVLEIEELHARDRMLAKALYDLGHLMGPG